MIDLLEDERFEWILVSKEEDIEDGILIDLPRREKFLKEANPDNVTIQELLQNKEPWYRKLFK